MAGRCGVPARTVVMARSSATPAHRSAQQQDPARRRRHRQGRRQYSLHQIGQRSGEPDARRQRANRRPGEGVGRRHQGRRLRCYRRGSAARRHPEGSRAARQRRGTSAGVAGRPNGTMTNGGSGRPSVPVLRLEVANKSELKSGVTVAAVTATKRPDGTFTADHIDFGRGDVLPRAAGLRSPYSEGRSRSQIPKRHRGHRNAGSPRRLIDLVTRSPA